MSAHRLAQPSQELKSMSASRIRDCVSASAAPLVAAGSEDDLVAGQLSLIQAAQSLAQGAALSLLRGRQPRLLTWIVLGMIASLLQARRDRIWPFGPLEIRERLPAAQREGRS
jgi:hypothetical protein